MRTGAVSGEGKREGGSREIVMLIGFAGSIQSRLVVTNCLIILGGYAFVQFRCIETLLCLQTTGWWSLCRDSKAFMNGEPSLTLL